MGEPVLSVTHFCPGNDDAAAIIHVAPDVWNKMFRNSCTKHNKNAFFLPRGEVISHAVT